MSASVATDASPPRPARRRRPPARSVLAEVERVAVELANLAGAEISNALGGMMAVSYKGDRASEQTWRDPVSEVDSRVEQLIRARLAEKFPRHGIIGEEFDDQQGDADSFTWVVDPIDGTTNFVNGFPLCAAAIGVVHAGRPVAGAVWCGASHALRPGVYHASQGGKLRFGNDEVTPRVNPAVQRRLAGVPRPIPGRGGWETRKTGSAALECAFVAAGVLRAARFEQPNIWDIAAGLALVTAAGCRALMQVDGEWVPFETFEPPYIEGRRGVLREWHPPIIIGRGSARDLVAGFNMEGETGEGARIHRAK